MEYLNQNKFSFRKYFEIKESNKKEINELKAQCQREIDSMKLENEKKENEMNSKLDIELQNYKIQIERNSQA